MTDSAQIITLMIFPWIVGGIFWVSAWAHFRQINRDKPLSPRQRRIRRYGTLFIVGAGYCLFVPVIFQMPKTIGVILVVGLAGLLWTLYVRRAFEGGTNPKAGA
jgi:hypothetical protein